MSPRVKDKTKLILQEMVKIFRENMLFIAFVFSGVLNDFILRVLTVGKVYKVKPVLTSMALILILSIVVILLAGKKRNYIYIIFSALISFINAANYMYYSHFNSFISVSVLNQAKHLTEMKNNVTQTLNLKILLFAIPTLLLLYVYITLKRKNYFEKERRTYSIRKEVLTPFVLGSVLLLLISSTLTDTDISRLVKQWNREYLVEQFGIYTFTTADIVKAASVPKGIDVNYEEFNTQLRDLENRNAALAQVKNKYSGALEGKDIYVIHYESVQRFAMGASFGDGAVTPFLNKLAKESLFFDNFYPQISVGTSSDSEFTFSTSLYPINNRTVFIDHADKDFITIQKLLKNKGYHTMSMHGNNGSFWNRNIMYPNIGYDEFLHKDNYNINEEVGLGLSDMSFYKQSVEKIKERKDKYNGPIMGTLISLSNHYPFDDLEKYGDFDTGYLEGTHLSNYFKSMHYADKCLESFFTEMDKAGLLDNAVVIIYGDHHAKISKADYESFYNYDKETGMQKDKEAEDYKVIDKAFLRQVRRTPLIIWTKDGSLQEKIEEPIGMIDVMPTLGNMLNVYNPLALGHDIFNVKDNIIIFPDGSYLTKDYYYSSSDVEVYDMKTNALLYTEKDFPEEIKNKVKDVDNTLDISSNIIEKNLVKYYETKFKKK